MNAIASLPTWASMHEHLVHTMEALAKIERILQARLAPPPDKKPPAP